MATRPFLLLSRQTSFHQNWRPQDSSWLLFLSPGLRKCQPGWDAFQGFCYKHFSARRSWEDAETRCREHGGHLANIMSPEEQSFINSRGLGLGASGLVGLSSSRGCLSKPVPAALAGIGRVPFTEGPGPPFFFLTFLAYWSLHLCSGKGWGIQGSLGGKEAFIALVALIVPFPCLGG